jgi:hypothetical protein
MFLSAYSRIDNYSNQDSEMQEISLTKGQVAIIDDADWPIVSEHQWYALWNKDTRSFYALTGIRKADGRWTTTQMHRLILGAQKGQQVDHLNHNTLDNRRSNIRLCTRSQNMHNRGNQRNNTSGYKGVFLHKQTGQWRTQIAINGKIIYLGRYKTPELAYIAYCQAAKERHGEFANFG